MSLFNLAFARQQGGQFILRIEDTDRARYQADSEAQIFDTLHWLGLDWDEGPDKGGPYAPYRQSERSASYGVHVVRLLEDGHAYYCWCATERLAQMREEQQKAKLPTGYDRLCVGKTREERAALPGFSEKPVVRMLIPDDAPLVFDDVIRGEVKAPRPDDQVIIKADGLPTYHLANVVDDHEMGISHVVRGEEWISSTPKHLALYQALGWQPPRFAHMPLLRNPDKSKVSKRKNPTSLLWYERQGYLPEAMLNFLALLGWSMPDGRETFGFDDVVANFSFERVVTSGPVFSMDKLQSINGQYIRELSGDELLRRLFDRDYVRGQLPLVQERMRTLNEFHTSTTFFYEDELSYPTELLVPKKAERSDVPDWLRIVRQRIEEFRPFQAAPLEETLRELIAEKGWNTGQVFMAVRVALTGSTQSPPLTETMEVLGREKTLQRLDSAVAQLQAS